MYDKYNIPGSFYIPAVTGTLYPAMIQEFKKRPRLEIGIHGWIHERLTDLDDQAEEERLLNKAIEFGPVLWVKSLWGTGRLPGHSANTPSISFAKPDFSMTAAQWQWTSRTNCFQTVGQPAWSNCWSIGFLTITRTSFPAAHSRRLNSFSRFIQDEFDGAYRESTLFMLTLHPMVSGHRSWNRVSRQADCLHEI